MYQSSLLMNNPLCVAEQITNSGSWPTSLVARFIHMYIILIWLKPHLYCLRTMYPIPSIGESLWIPNFRHAKLSSCWWSTKDIHTYTYMSLYVTIIHIYICIYVWHIIVCIYDTYSLCIYTCDICGTQNVCTYKYIYVYIYNYVWYISVL